MQSAVCIPKREYSIICLLDTSIVIGVNVRDADIQQVVANIQKTLDKNIKLQPGYYFEYGGQFENLQNAINTLLIVIPVALMLILLILFFAFKNITYTLMVFSTVPLSLLSLIHIYGYHPKDHPSYSKYFYPESH